MGSCGSRNRARTHCCAGSRDLDVALCEGAIDVGRASSWLGDRVARVGRKRVQGNRPLPVGRSRRRAPRRASCAHRFGSRSGVRRDHGRDTVETRLASLGGCMRAFNGHPDRRRDPGRRILVRHRSPLYRLNGWQRAEPGGLRSGCRASGRSLNILSLSDGLEVSDAAGAR